MRLLADEGVEKPVVERLRKDGLIVDYILETDRGADDETVLALANSRNAVLLTADKDFGELVFRLQRVSRGIVLLRLAGLALDAKSELVATMFQEHGAELEFAFTVLTPESIRIRKSEDK